MKRPQRDLNAPPAGAPSDPLTAPRAASPPPSPPSQEPAPNEDTASHPLGAPDRHTVTATLRDALDALRSLDGRRAECLLVGLLERLHANREDAP